MCFKDKLKIFSWSEGDNDSPVGASRIRGKREIAPNFPFFRINLGNPPKQAGKGSFEMRPTWTQICADAMDLGGQKNAIFFSLRSDRAQFCRNLFSGGVKNCLAGKFLSAAQLCLLGTA